MTTDTTTAKSAEEQITAYKALLFDIATSMGPIVTLAYEATQSGGEHQASQLMALAALAERVGYTADRAIGFEAKPADRWLLTKGAAEAFVALEATHDD